jgi:hypothetical protein
MTLFLIAVVAVAGWAGSLYLFPFGPCVKCGGSGRRKGSNAKRFGRCVRCGGDGRRLRFGARFVHRSVLSAMSERRRAAEKRAKEKGEL